MECTICLDTIHEPHNVFECDHVYHMKCIDKWEGTCPNCRSRRKVKESNYILYEIKIEKNVICQCSDVMINGRIGIPPFGRINMCSICGMIGY